MSTRVKESSTLRPLRRRGTASTLRLQVLMEERQRHEVGQRVKELRNASPQTNRSIADYVGVGERAVANWVAGEGIAWENAKKVAELFEVDVQWLWSGRDRAPDVLQTLDGGITEPLHRIEEKLDDILDWIAGQESIADADDADQASAPSESRPRARRAASDRT